jgi:phytoene synthase
VTALDASYRRCEQLTKAYGTTYYWSARLLPATKQPHVYALYAFCRHADEIVDDLGDVPTEERAEALASLADELFVALDKGSSEHEVLAALVDTADRYAIDRSCFERFLRSMTMDLTVTSYETYDDLLDYMDGSAAVIGEMMLPILGALDPAARVHARDLGLAFQLTNFLRDVGEDLDRDRVYIPRADLERFGVDPFERRVTDGWRALMQFEMERTDALYRSADRGLAMLPPRSARSIQSARTLYAGILDRIVRNDYDVFTRRARVPLGRKLWTVASSFVGPAPSSSTADSRVNRSFGTSGSRKPYGSRP